MHPNRYVLDTNIWISYFLSGKLLQLYESTTKNKIELFTSKKLIQEIAEVIGRRKIAKYLTGSAKDYIEFHKAICKEVDPSNLYRELPDPDDNFLVDLAIKAEAPYIVTGDKKLLAVLRAGHVRFISLTTFTRKIE